MLQKGTNRKNGSTAFVHVDINKPFYNTDNNYLGHRIFNYSDLRCLNYLFVKKNKTLHF